MVFLVLHMGSDSSVGNLCLDRGYCRCFTNRVAQQYHFFPSKGSMDKAMSSQIYNIRKDFE